MTKTGMAVIQSQPVWSENAETIKTAFVDVEVLARFKNENRRAVAKHKEKRICEKLPGKEEIQEQAIRPLTSFVSIHKLFH